jgi:hypothetical protein
LKVYIHITHKRGRGLGHCLPPSESVPALNCRNERIDIFIKYFFIYTSLRSNPKPNGWELKYLLHMHMLTWMITGRVGYGFYTTQNAPKPLPEPKPKGCSGGKTKPTHVEFRFFHSNPNPQQEHTKLISCSNSAQIHWPFPFSWQDSNIQIFLQQKTVKF